MVPSSSLTLSVDQSIRHVNELPIHKADQQFTAIFSFSMLSTVIHANTQTHRWMHKVQLEFCKEAQAHTLYPWSQLFTTQHHTVSVSHTPGELNAVNICTSRLLIVKLFMLSSGRIHIRGETGEVAPHHSKQASDTHASVNVCLWRSSPPQREKQIFCRALELAPS